MKKITALITFTILTLATFTARADNTSFGTTAGAISGALFGQAIGRNTEGTVIGATVGGIVGYMIGNEMDKEAGRYSRPLPADTYDYEQVVWGGRHSHDPVCRETEMLAVINGRAEKIRGVACLENGRWVTRRTIRRTEVIHSPPSQVKIIVNPAYIDSHRGPKPRHYWKKKGHGRHDYRHDYRHRNRYDKAVIW